MLYEYDSVKLPVNLLEPASKPQMLMMTSGLFHLMTAGLFPLFPKVGNQPQDLALFFFFHLISQRKDIRDRDLLLSYTSTGDDAAG